MGTENKNPGSNADDLMGLIPLSDALGKVYDEITARAASRELEGRDHQGRQPQLAEIERRVTHLQYKQTLLPEDEAELTELRERYDQLLHQRAQDI